MPWFHGVLNLLFRKSPETGRPLSPREREVAALAHLTTAQIGIALGISYHTVQCHIDQARLKLDLDSKEEVYAWHCQQEMRQELTEAQALRIVEFCQSPTDVAWVARWFGVTESDILSILEDARRAALSHRTGEFA
jgi:DNA-binding CsgD family transcriptional regulator